VLATDGLTECRDVTGAMLGDEGVIALLRDAADDPQALCDRLAGEVERRAGGDVSDDLAILAVRILAADVATVPGTFSTFAVS
jgi:serine phosphatase RsbU (regulator of sigma subunit)